MRRQIVASLWALLAAATAHASPEVARTFKAQGDGLVQRGKPEEAIHSYESAIQEDPEWLVAYDALAASLFAAGKFDDVIARLRPVVEKHREDYPNGWYSLGYAYRKTGRNAESVEAYKQYTKLKPDDAEGYYGLGRAQLSLDKKDDAVASFNRYIKLEKRPTERRWVEKAKTEIEKLKTKGAKADEPDEPAEPGERTTTNRADSFAEQADAQAKKGKWDGAYALYQKARALDGASTRAYDGIGESGIRTHRYKEMVPMFRNAIADNPGYASGFYYLGRALAELGKKSEALDALKRFAALQPSNPDGQFHLGMMLKNAGQSADAQKALGKYLEVENRPGSEHEQSKKTAQSALKEMGASK
jgi:tetratricopeptide (TPR) repeat protein